MNRGQAKSIIQDAHWQADGACLKTSDEIPPEALRALEIKSSDVRVANEADKSFLCFSGDAVSTLGNISKACKKLAGSRTTPAL